MKNLEKSHSTDAFVIANGNIQERAGEICVEQKRKNNRCLQLNRKGFAPSIRKRRYTHQPKDLVRIKGTTFEVIGVHSYGTQIKLKNQQGVCMNSSVKKLSDFHFQQGTLIWKTPQFIHELKHHGFLGRGV